MNYLALSPNRSRPSFVSYINSSASDNVAQTPSISKIIDINLSMSFVSSDFIVISMMYQMPFHDRRFTKRKRSSRLTSYSVNYTGEDLFISSEHDSAILC